MKETSMLKLKRGSCLAVVAMIMIGVPAVIFGGVGVFQCVRNGITYEQVVTCIGDAVGDLGWVDIIILSFVLYLFFDYFLAFLYGLVVIPVGLVMWAWLMLTRIFVRLVSGRPLPPLEPEASILFLFRGIFSGRPRDRW